MSTILIVDDKPDNLCMLQALLTGNGFSVVSADEGTQALKLARASAPDLVVSDILMPGMDGFALCREWRQDPALRHIPFVFYTATYTDQRDEKLALSMGADRFLVKPLEPDVLMEQLQVVLTQCRESGGTSVREPGESDVVVMRQYNQALVRKLEQKLVQLEGALRQRDESERRLEHLNRVLRAIRGVNQLIVRERDPEALTQKACAILVDHRSYLGAMIILTDDEGNPRTYAETGMTEGLQPLTERMRQGILPPCCGSAKAHAGGAFLLVTDRSAACGTCPLAAPCAHTDTMCMPLRHGEKLLGFLMVPVEPVHAVDPEEQSIFAEMAGDIAFALHSISVEAEHHEMEQQLAQAQKMESVGRLAGGVAHDFNNLLMGVMNYAELCRDKIEPDHPIREWLNEITVDAERSTKLTHQLLAFARKQIIAPKVVDLNDAIGSMLKLLRRLIGEDIAMKFTADPDTWTVKMDPVQIDQILANLCVNARDAISGVGSISIETSHTTFDAAYCAGHSEAAPGDYTLLTVTDSGCGMDKETLKNIFEPFFTTKGEGEGTGLGLATVYGIVKQNDGFINVYSEPGAGTTFKIYLPRFVGAEASEATAAPEAPPHGTETVLLVEDEKSIRITTDLFLKDLGYTVLVAEDPKEALLRASEHPGEIDLLITDVVMPGMSGRDLANRLLELRPAIKHLFISGFTADVIAQRGILDDGVNFLSKPFGRDVLARKVREVLDA